MFAASKTDGSAVAPDAQFNYVTMLLHGDGTNGAQNNTFVDVSTNNYTITRNGNTTQGSFSPYGSNWSNYFNGSTDFFNTAQSANFTFDANFTVEFWVYITASQNSDIVGTANNAAFIGSGNSGWIISNYTSGGVKFGYQSNNSWVIDTTVGMTPTLNSWNHIAIVRSGSTITGYLNGVAGTTPITSSATFTSNLYGVYVGSGAGNQNSKLGGYVSNLRVVKGTAVYTSTFTPPTAPLTAISGTQLLTCQSNRFIDNSANAFTATVNGTPSVQRFNPFGTATAYSTSVIGGSGYFDGSGDYLTGTGSSNLAFGSGDFTIELWVYFNSVASSPAYQFIYSSADSSVYLNTPVIYWFQSSSSLRFNNGSDLISATGIQAKTWYHVAVSRSGTTTKMFLNGVQVGSATDATVYINQPSRPMIGANGNGSGSEPFSGYISDVRCVKGTAVYTSAFTPPTAPLTAITNTQLLCNMTNGAIFDNAMMNDLETVGVAQISTSEKKYGTGSISFGSVVGNDNYLLAPATPNLEFGSGDFTIEFWWYPISTARQALYHGSFGVDWSIGIDYSSVSTNQKIGIWASSNGTSWNLINADSGGNGIGTTTITQNAWNHIAFVRNGTTWMLFVNGNRDLNLTSISGSIVDRSTYRKGINVWWAASALNEASGYMDDFRITKGYARYTANFTPPTASFSDKGPI